MFDFGKSLCTIETRKHGFVSSRFSTIQDILYLLLTSISTIEKQNLTPEDTKNIIQLANFISGTQYCPNEFTSMNEITSFFNIHRKYEHVTKHKQNLENKTCLDFVNYISDRFSCIKVEKVDISESKLSNGDPELIKESVLGKI
jgi:hypothetical protein